MIKNYLVEYNHEFDNSIQPNNILDLKHGLSLEYRELSDYELQEIEKFCKIYNLTFSITNSHNLTHVIIVNLS
jgi:hypothetical protein